MPLNDSERRLQPAASLLFALALAALLLASSWRPGLDRARVFRLTIALVLAAMSRRPGQPLRETATATR